MTVLEAPPSRVIRERIREGIARRTKPEWRAPVLGDFACYQEVLAFDAALRNTGWVLLVRTSTLGFHVKDHGTIRLATPHKSYMATWDLAEQLAVAVRRLLSEQRDDYIKILVESPSVGGGWRTESSLIAGLQIWQASRRWQGKGFYTVAADHVSRVLTGNREHDKKQIAAAVAAIIPETARRSWNEHERDAAAVALAHLYDQVHPPE
jgi:Holliday junction resolvasome RuvABC endonuclease subunit